MTRKMVPADPAARRRAVWLIGSAALLGAPALAILLATLREEPSAATIRRWLWTTVAFASGGALAAGAYLAWLARRVHQAGQFPLPGQRVVRDTPLHEERAARQLAWLGWALAAALWAAGLALPVLLWRLLHNIGE